MACYLMVPNHYLNQCCLEIIGIHPSAIARKNAHDKLTKYYYFSLNIQRLSFVYQGDSELKKTVDKGKILCVSL